MSNILSLQIERFLKAIEPNIDKVDAFDIPQQTTELKLSELPRKKLSELNLLFTGYNSYYITDNHIFLFNI